MAETGLRDFAAARGLELGGGDGVRPLTPALAAALRDGIAGSATGTLAPGLEGTIFDVRGETGATVILTGVRGSAAFMPALACRDRAASGDRRPAELPAERWEGTELESTGFNRRYGLLTLAGQDAGLVRELFSPSLIAWLERDPPPGFSFELNEGNLTIALPGRLRGAELEELAGLAAALRARIQGEIDEEGALDPDLYDESVKLRAVERGLSEVEWDEPPAGVQVAVARYRREAARKPSVLLKGLMWAAISGGIVAVVLALAVHPVAGLLAGAIVAPFGFWIGRLVGASAFRWEGTASVSRVGLEAFARGYAASRGLELESRWRFHAEHRDLAVPGFADHVFAGRLPNADGLRGRLLMLGDAAEMRALGQEIAYVADRPLASSALLVSADGDLPEDAGRGVELPEDYRLEIAGREVLVWRPIAGNLLRTAAGTDRFCGKAAAVVGAVLAGSPAERA